MSYEPSIAAISVRLSPKSWATVRFTVRIFTNVTESKTETVINEQFPGRGSDLTDAELNTDLWNATSASSDATWIQLYHS